MEDLVVELGEVALSNRENSREEQQTQKKTPLSVNIEITTNSLVNHHVACFD